MRRWSGPLDPRVLDALAPIAPDPNFERIGRWRWVAPSVDGIRPMIDVQAYKGATRAVAWGVSLDFVPVMGSTKLSWKTSAEKARLDLRAGPGAPGREQFHDWCTFQDWDGPGRAARIARRVRRQAARDLAPLTSIEAIVAAFERRGPALNQPADRYTQTDLAWGLCLDALGREAEADAYLERFCGHVGVDPGDPILAKARARAQARHAATKNAPEPRLQGA